MATSKTGAAAVSAIDIFRSSDAFAERLKAAIDLPLYDESPRVTTSDLACSLALEHWNSVRSLLRLGMLSSALVVHRAQFEATTRSLWVLYCASEGQIAKLCAQLSSETEQLAKNLPSENEMMEALGKKAPRQAVDALSRFKDSSWKALNSYVHAGIHPIQRHRNGYPTVLMYDVLRHSNGLGLITCMQSVVLAGCQPAQRNLIAIASSTPECMPPPL